MIKEYLNYLYFNKRYSVHTCNTYANALRLFVAYMAPKSKSWSTISKEDIQGFIADCMQKKANTIIVYISAIRGIYNYIARTYSIANPAKYLQSPRKDKLVHKTVSISEIHNAILHESNNDIRLAIMLMSFAGLRASEVLNINYEDIDVSNNRILVLGKGQKERYVYLTDGMMSLLGTKKQGKVFGGYEDRAFRYLVFLAFRRIGVSCSPHVLRHTFATQAINNGMRLDVLREVLGHTSISTTQIYLSNQEEVIKKETIMVQQKAMVG